MNTSSQYAFLVNLTLNFSYNHDKLEAVTSLS